MNINKHAITCYRGEHFTLDFKIVNDDGSPYVLGLLDNPYIVINISSNVYNENDKYNKNIWLSLKNKPQFISTSMLPVDSFDVFPPKYNDVSYPTNYDEHETVFYKVNEDGSTSYKYYDDGKYKDYDLHIIVDISSELTRSWTSSSYLYTISLVTGTLVDVIKDDIAPIQEIVYKEMLLQPTKINVLDNADYLAGLQYTPDGKNYDDGFVEGQARGEEIGYQSALLKLEPLTATENGTYTSSDDKIGFDRVNVEIDTDKFVQQGYDDGFESAKTKLETINVTENGEYTPTGESIGFNKVNVNIVGDGKLQALISGATDFCITAKDLDGVTAIRSYAFYYGKNLKSVDLPDSVQSIGTYAFYNSGIENLSIGDGVSIVPTRMCDRCSNLTDVNLGNYITSIQNGAFQYCTNLTYLAIPASVMTISDYALGIGGDVKATIRMLGKTPPTLSSMNVFWTGNNSSTQFVEKIIIPKDTFSAYRSATNWSAFYDIMEEATE